MPTSRAQHPSSGLENRVSRRTLISAAGAVMGTAAMGSLAAPHSVALAQAQQVAPHIDGPLYFEQLGKSGTPIAFVHPAPMDHSCFLYQMAHLSTWFRCIAMDLPGWGKSPAAQP